MKTIILFSNPFGYGPTGKMLAVADELVKNTEIDVHIAGSGLCEELSGSSGLPFYQLDERSETEISRFLARYNPLSTIVFSSQNRFAIRASQKQGIKSYFLDGLAWFWKDIPEDHFIANHIFWTRFPEIENKLPPDKSIELIGAVAETLPPQSTRSSEILIHIGGIENPLDNTLPCAYLLLLARSLREVPKHIPVTVAGGSKATCFLKNALGPSHVRIGSFSHKEFMHLITHSKKLLTTAGQTATIESFVAGTPVSFLPPTNLSQAGLTKILLKHNAARHNLEWNNYTAIPKDTFNLTEKDGIAALRLISEDVLSTPNKRDHLVADILTEITNQDTTQDLYQRDFINSIGTNGATQICKRIFLQNNL